MQTFLPHTTFEESAKVLDMKRLGKQRVETMQILSALTKFKIDPDTGQAIEVDKPGWVNHPITRMWKGYEIALARYGVVICEEWTSRGYNDTCRSKILRITSAFIDANPRQSRKVVMPPWVTEDFASAHRAHLLSKDEEFYRQHGWTEEPKPYAEWPF